MEYNKKSFTADTSAKGKIPFLVLSESGATSRPQCTSPGPRCHPSRPQGTNFKLVTSLPHKYQSRVLNSHRDQL